MSQRRMFSNRIANSARFLQMPSEAQLLYFHLCLRADDDGIVEAYPIIRLLGTAPDACQLLLEKKFVKQLNEDQVIVITDWLEHNTIRADRKVDSIYKHLLPSDVKTIEAKPRSDVENNTKRIGGQSTDGISKVKLGKVKIIKKDAVLEKPQASMNYLKNIPEDDLKEIGKKYSVSRSCILARAEDVIDYCEAKGKTYKDYKAALRNFIKSHLERHPDDRIVAKMTYSAPITAPQKERTPEEQARVNKKLADMRQAKDKLFKN